jgi:hypothetical protein
MEIRGFCTLGNTPGSLVTILGNLVIDRGQVFDAVTDGNIDVLGSVQVKPGAALGLGCDPVAVSNPPCTVNTADRVVGNIAANQPLAVIVHRTTVIGNVSYSGGGGGSTSCAGHSFMGGPPFSTYEDGSVGGNLSITGMTTCWFGIFRTTVSGNVNVSNNFTSTHDPDAPEIATNTIAGALSCFGNFPAPTFGDSGGAANVAHGGAFGQCPKLLLPNPNPNPPGPPPTK